MTNSEFLVFFQSRAAVGKRRLSVQVASRLLDISWGEAEQHLCELALDPTSGVSIRYEAGCQRLDCGSTRDVTEAVLATGRRTVELTCHVCGTVTRAESYVDFYCTVPSP